MELLLLGIQDIEDRRGLTPKLPGSISRYLSWEIYCKVVPVYSGLKNRCNVWGFWTDCDAALDSVEISLSAGGMKQSTPSWLSNSTLFIRFE